MPPRTVEHPSLQALAAKFGTSLFQKESHYYSFLCWRRTRKRRRGWRLPSRSVLSARGCDSHSAGPLNVEPLYFFLVLLYGICFLFSPINNPKKRRNIYIRKGFISFSDFNRNPFNGTVCGIIFALVSNFCARKLSSDHF